MTGSDDMSIEALLRRPSSSRVSLDGGPRHVERHSERDEAVVNADRRGDRPDRRSDLGGYVGWVDDRAEHVPCKLKEHASITIATDLYPSVYGIAPASRCARCDADVTSVAVDLKSVCESEDAKFARDAGETRIGAGEICG